MVMIWKGYDEVIDSIRQQRQLQRPPRCLQPGDVCRAIMDCIITHPPMRKLDIGAHRGVPRRVHTRNCPIRKLLKKALKLSRPWARLPHDMRLYEANILKCYTYNFNKRLKIIRRRRRRPIILPELTEEVHQIVAEEMHKKLQKKYVKLMTHLNNPKIRDKSSDQWLTWWRRRVRCRYKQVDTHAREHVSDILEEWAHDVEPMAAEEIQEPEDNVCRVVSLNIESIRQNGTELLMETRAHPDVYALQELKTDTTFRMLGSLKWRLISFSRNNHGGGTGFLVRPGLHVERLRHLWHREGRVGAEVCWIRIQLESGLWIYIGSVYVPPQRPLSEIDRFIKIIADQLHDFRALGECAGVLLTGDFNSSWYTTAQLQAHNLDGQGGAYITHGARWRNALTTIPGFPTIQILNDATMEFTHMPKTQHGVKKTLIDYAVWFGTANDITSFRTLNTFLTAHRMLEISIRTDLPQLAKPAPHTLWRRIVDGSRTNADELYSELFSEYMEKLYAGDIEDHDPPSNYEEWVAGLQEGLRTICGEMQPTRIMRGNQSKWWTKRLSKLTRKRKSIRRRIYKRKCRNQTYPDLQRKNLDLKAEIKRALYKSQKNYWIKHRRTWTMENESIVGMFRILRSLNRRSREVYHSREELRAAWEPIFCSQPPPGCHAAEHAQHNAEAAEELREERVGPLLPVAERIDLEEFDATSRHLLSRKAPGEDGITNEILRQLPLACKRHLISLYNDILNGEDIPDDWLRSLVCLIAKEAVPGAADYRPISLLACTVKLFENIIHRRIIAIFKANGAKFEYDSGGFHQWRGCPESILRYRMIDDELTRLGKMGAAIFLDIKKAYDTVPIPNLIRKIRNRFPFLPEYIVLFVERWLSRHIHRILMGDEMDTLDLETNNRGLFQGSVLAPSLFNMFIDDFFEKLREGISLEADDNNPAIFLEPAQGVQFSLYTEASDGDDDVEPLDLNLDGSPEGDVGRPEPGGFGIPLMDDDTPAPIQSNSWPRNVSSVQFTTRALGYADDLAVLACGSPEEIQADLERTMLICEYWARENGMKWAPSKCKWMRLGRKSESVDLQVTLLNENLEHVDEFSYLGLTFGERRLKYLRQKKRFRQIKAEFLDPHYRMFEARYGCNLRVGLHIISAQVIPKLMYGARMYPLHRHAEELWIRVCRKVLGCYRDDSTTKIRTFLGCRKLEDLASSYTVRFILKLALGDSFNLTPMRRMMLISLFNTDEPLRSSWVNHARAQIEHAVRKGWFCPPALQPGNSVDWTEIRKLLLSCEEVSTEREAFDERYRRTKPHSHTSMKYCPEKAHFTFRFYTGRFNAHDVMKVHGRGVEADLDCFFCGAAGGDTPSHLVECTDIRVDSIMREQFQVLVHNGFAGSFWNEFVDLVRTPIIAVSQGRWSRETEVCWRTICHTHLRLWKRRKPLFAEWWNEMKAHDAVHLLNLEEDDAAEIDDYDEGDGHADLDEGDAYEYDDVAEGDGHAVLDEGDAYEHDDLAELLEIDDEEAMGNLIFELSEDDGDLIYALDSSDDKSEADEEPNEWDAVEEDSEADEELNEWVENEANDSCDTSSDEQQEEQAEAQWRLDNMRVVIANGEPIYNEADVFAWFDML